MDSAVSTTVGLLDCDQEPIHVPGSIQSFGFLLGLDSDWRVSHASANTGMFIGRPAAGCLGLPLDMLIEAGALHTLRNQITALQIPDGIQRSFGLRLIADRPLFDVAMHRSGDAIIFEAELAATDEREAAALVRAMVARLKHSDGLDAFLRDGVRHVQALTGFNRVMAYRFDGHGNGEVLAEAIRGSQESFIGLHYPATDIPVQARALYLRNAFRIIANVVSDPVGILASPDDDGTPLDQSLSVLRAVSPIHIQYLKNMGVAASLSISIVVDGKLWGLFVCHHSAARLPSFAYRTAAELFGEMFSMMLEGRLRREAIDHDLRARALAELLIAEIAYDSRLLTDTKRLGELIYPTISAAGLGVNLDRAVSFDGATPDREQFAGITAMLAGESPNGVFVTECLPDLLPAALAYADVAAGLLAIPLLPGAGNYLVLFRPEIMRTIQWAGDPNKLVSGGDGQLTPRASFAAWAEAVSGTCTPFSAGERAAAETIRLALLQARVRTAELETSDTRALRSGQDILIAELNHRVRNILALIRGLISQTRISGETTENFIATLDERVQSLARAHDQITSDRWGPARLSELIDTEAGAYLAGKHDRLKISGPDVLVFPAAFTTLALVFHELMTNAAKYGALSDNGAVTVAWQLDDEGDLRIDWSEDGGPEIAPPSRRGFGSVIIERSVPYDLGGEASLSFPSAGLRASFRVPARHLAGISAAKRISAPIPVAADRNMLLGMNVLLVEDSLIIAMDCEDTLRSLGARHVETAASVAEALAVIAAQDFQFALLDFNLGAETSVAVADLLIARNIPFAFATGYDGNLQDRGHANAPVIGKPYGEKQLMPVLSGLGFGSPRTVLVMEERGVPSNPRD